MPGQIKVSFGARSKSRGQDMVPNQVKVINGNVTKILQLLHVIVISRFLKRYLKAKRKRAPAYSRALYQIRYSAVSNIVRGRLRSGYHNHNRILSK